MLERTFTLGEILSVTTGIVLAPMSKIHELLDFMTGDTLFTHQLPRAADECKPVILRQHPDLAGIEPPEFCGAAEVDAWLGILAPRLGATRQVAPMDPVDHTVIDPVAELNMIRPGMPVIGVEVPDRDRGEDQKD